MIYRSKQRGWLEVDILLGSWAAENIPLLTKAELDDFEEVLKEETVDMYNFLTAKVELPIHLESNLIMKRIMKDVMSKNLSGPEAYSSVKIKANLT